MQWTSDLSVGIEIIDSQHKELILRINSLVDAIKSHTCKYKIGDVIAFLEDYIVEHFGTEEKLMAERHYPGTAHHIAEHKKFIKNFSALKKELLKLEGGKKPGSYDLSVETNRIVVDWILEHIAQVDRALGKYLNT